MNIDEVLDELESLEKEECLAQAKKTLQELYSAIKIGADKFDLNIDTLISALNQIIILAANSDGRIDKAEYQLYCELVSCLAIEQESIEVLREFAREAESEEDFVDVLIAGIYNVSLIGLENEEKTKDTIIKFIALIFTYNGTIDSKEIEMLNKINSIIESINEESENSDDENSDCCSSSSLQQNKDEPIKILRYGSSLARSDDYIYLSVGAEIKNPNVSRIARNAVITIVVKDSSGRILEESENTINYIDSNSVFYYGDQIVIYSGIPDSYSISVQQCEFIDGPENSTLAKFVSASHFSLERSRWGSSYSFTGNIANYSDSKLFVNAFFTFYDSNDKIIGGVNEFIGNMYAKQETHFQTSLNFICERSKVKMSPSFNFFDLVK